MDHDKKEKQKKKKKERSASPESQESVVKKKYIKKTKKCKVEVVTLDSEHEASSFSPQKMSHSSSEEEVKV